MTTDDIRHDSPPELDEAFRCLGAAFAAYWAAVAERMRAEQPEMVQQLGALLHDGGSVRAIIDPATLSVAFEAQAPDGSPPRRFHTMFGRERSEPLGLH